MNILLVFINKKELSKSIQQLRFSQDFLVDLHLFFYQLQYDMQVTEEL
jgi:hypothetical protein